MTDPDTTPSRRASGENSLKGIAITVLRRGRLVVALSIGVTILVVAITLLLPRKFVSSATFIPESEESPMSGLALAASQFGVQLPMNKSVWGPAVYVELLRSPTLLERVVLDSFSITDSAGPRAPLMDVLEVDEVEPARRIELAGKVLRRRSLIMEDKRLGGVRVTVTTHSPELSLGITRRLLEAVEEFNIKTRASQAVAERRFVDDQVASAEKALRDAEDRMQGFLQRNRDFAGSPALTFEEDRLRRGLSLRQSVYTTLVQQLEEAQIREVRDTPVFTMLEGPRRAATPQSRRVIPKALVGATAGLLLGLLIAFLAEGGGVHRGSDPDAGELAALLEGLRPQFMRKSRS